MGQRVHLHLDPLGGMAGDMFLAALLDAYPEHAEDTFAAMRAAGLPDSWQARLLRHNDGVLSGRRVMIEGPNDDFGGAPGHFREIRASLGAAPLRPAVRERAIAIFAALAEAEAAVHGVPVDEVHFHEIADWDSVADIVGAAWLIEALAGATWSVGALPVGSGRISTRHGPLTVPAPAAAHLLAEFTMHDDGIAGERVTPTGAAILKHLQCAPGVGSAPRRLAGTGIGFGTKVFPGISNVVRVLAFEDAVTDVPWQWEDIVQIAFEVDDQTPEDLGVALDRLRAVAGVRDVVQSPVMGKKNRLAIRVQAIVLPEARDAAIAACFAETTTIGLRVSEQRRAALIRREDRTASGLRVKRARRPDGSVTAKAESDVTRSAGGAGERDELRRKAEGEALGLPWPEEKKKD
jgi:uncharacterized protein (TIGR00299 family) protein